MTGVLLGSPKPVEAAISIPKGVAFEAWLNWTDQAGATINLAASYTASLAFSAGGTGEVVPQTITEITNSAIVGRITLASTSPNMKLFIPAVVTVTLIFRRIRAILEVTDPALTFARRWMEADVTLDRGVGLT